MHAALLPSVMNLHKPHSLAQPASTSIKSRSRQYRLTCQAAKKSAGKLLKDAMTNTEPNSNLYMMATNNYLNTIGISGPEATRVIDMITNPNSLFSTRAGRGPSNPNARKVTVEEMQQMVSFLQEMEFTCDQVKQLISQYPQVMCYSINERITPLFMYLKTEVGLTQAQVVEVVVKRPTVMGMDRTNLARVLSFLEESGKEKEEIIQLLKTTL